MRVSSNATMTDAQYEVFRAELKRLRTKEGLTGAAFGELVGCSAVHISSIETGKKKPSPELAERIADAFDLKVSDMFVSNDERVWEMRKKYGKSIKARREEKGISMNTMAGALGIPFAVYKEYEQGLCSITDREMDIINRLLGIGEERKVEVKTVVEEVPADICEIILGHIKDLSVDGATQKKVWQYFSKVKLDAEERRLFG